MKTITQFIAAFTCLVISASMAGAAERAADFVITNRETGKPIRRDDFKGKILFLDFFAYWCPPCQTSSPTVETAIAEYYKAKGGNPHGVKVQVIGVNIESESPASTDDFINTAGLETVADDFGNSTGAWAQFGEGSIPHFVIINGVESASHRQWEILHSQAGFMGATFYRDLIDSIKPAATAPEISVEQPTGGKLIDGKARKSFGIVKVNNRSGSKTFTIRNLGNANLSGLAIKKSGDNTGDFLVSMISKSIVKPGGSATFKVVFKPTAKGMRRAVIRIRSNDSNENPFDINLTGTGS